MSDKPNIKQQLEFLIKLQDLDAKIFRLKREKDAKPKILEQINNDFIQKQGTLKQHDSVLKALQLKLKEKDVDLRAKEDSIKKYKAQLFQIKTNKEYAALQKEIEGLKADGSVLEDEILLLLDDVEKKQKDIKDEKDLIVQEEQKKRQDEERIKKEILQIDEDLKVLETQRAELAPNIEKNILKKYERVLHNKDGLALVAVKNHACQGCFLNLPPQVINEIRMNEHIVSCESCARILYMAEGEE